MKKLLVALTMFAGALAASALTVDTTVSDHCVLLQNAANIVKGKAVANSTVSVTLGGTSIGSGKADSSGNYKVTVNPGAASFESRDLVVTDGSDTKTVADVLVGEVWLVGGQSNAFNMMDPGVMSGDYQTAYPLWKAQFNCPNVRVVISTPTQACGGVNDYYKANTSQNLRWIPCMKPNEPDIKKVSPLAFFFGKKLSEYKNCPVGILLAGNGGTPIGCHMTTEAKNRGRALTGSTVNEGGKANFSACYTRLDTIAARGAIWAQGETDSERGGSKYRFLLQALFEDWRSAAHRNDPDFPVLIYGLANFDNNEYETQNKYPRIRWEQEKAIEDGLVPYAGVFHSIDLSGSMQKGYAKSVHPDQKPELAERALLAARNLAYGENIAYRCPNPTEAYFNADRTKVIVRFPSSVTLTRDGAYTHVPFRVRNVDLDTSWGGTSVNPTDVTVGSDGHSLEIAFTGLTLNTVEYGNSVAFCNVSGTQDETLVFEQRIFDQNGFPLPPFELNIANAASGPADTHVHTWGAAAYAWSADDATCTATAACTGDSSHTATQTVAPTLTVTVEPTATTTGTGVLTAAFKAPFAVQTKTVTIPVKSATAVVPATPTAEYEGVQLWADGPYWCTFNVGANRPTENGNFFSWGGTRDFVKGELAKFNGGETTMDKSVDELAEYLDADGVLLPCYDGASVYMGGSWRMPTKEELAGIFDTTKCSTTLTTVDGVYGVKVSGKGAYAGKSIFLPTGGFYQSGSAVSSSTTYYLSSTPSGTKQFHGLQLHNGYFNTCTANRSNGYAIRAVSSVDPAAVDPSHVHTWGTPSYTWAASSDGYACKASVTCTENALHKKSVTATVTYTVVTEATTTSVGLGRYTATFSDTTFTTQTKEVEIPMIHVHTWGAPKYTWTATADGYTCNATMTCTTDGSHKQSETVTATYEVITETSMSAPGLGRYTATFADSAFTTQTKDVEILQLHEHTYGTPTYTWSSTYKTCTASAVCTVSGCVETISETVNVSANVTKEPTTDATGTCIYTATFTNPKFSQQTETVTLPKVVPGPDDNGHEFVQLWANGPYWAMKNVGATSVSGVGKFFSWGSTTGTEKGATTKYNGGCQTMGKSASALQTAGYVDASANLLPAHDAAHVVMGGDWRMPTKAELDALMANCVYEPTTVDGLKCLKVTGKDDFASASIILPVVGYYSNGGTYGNEEFNGFYASATVYEDSSNSRFYGLNIQAAWMGVAKNMSRDNGYAIRGVLPYVPGANPGTGTHTHSWGTPSYTWSADNMTCTASRTCSGCSESDSVSATATYSDSGTTRTFTAVFASPFTTQTKSVTITDPGTGGGEDPVAPSGHSGTLNGHDGVQLWKDGPYWATMNLGAEKSSDFGYYYQWGGTVGYAHVNGKWIDQNGNSASGTWYNGSPSYTLTGSGLDRVLSKSSDAANACWGEGWRMPTATERNALKENTTYQWVTVDGVPGSLFTGKGDYSGNSIFIPDTGHAGSPASTGYAYYFTGSVAQNGDETKCAAYNLYSSGMSGSDVHRASKAYTVRAVCDSVTPSGPTHTHAWGTPTYTWSADGKSCTATRACTGCTEKETETVTATFVTTKEATTEATGLGHYEATFKNSAFAKQSGADVTIPKKKQQEDPPHTDPSTSDLGVVQLWENGPYWATNNLGSASESGTGDFYMWGGTVGYRKDGTSWKGTDGSTSSNPFGNSVGKDKNLAALTSAGILDGNGNLNLTYDAAKSALGDGWRLPTKEDVKALQEKCTITGKTVGGVKGVEVRGQGAFANNAIFLPCSGYGEASNGGLNNVGGQTYYITSTPADNTTQASAMAVTSTSLSRMNVNRNNGYQIRPVRDTVPSTPTGSVDWDHPEVTISTGVTAGTAWPALKSSALAAADAAKLQAWAKNVGKVAFESASAIKVEAFLLNCANTDAAIATAKDAFKFTSFDPEQLPTASDFADKGYNGVVTIQGRAALDSGDWATAKTGDKFYRAVLSL